MSTYLRFLNGRAPQKEDLVFHIQGQAVPVKVARKRIAKHYILKVTHLGWIQLTLPNRGNLREGLAFLEKHRVWIAQQWLEWLKRSHEHQDRQGRLEVLYRGHMEPITLSTEDKNTIAHFARLSFPVDLSRMSLGDWMNSWLRYQAGKDLPARLAKWALKYDFKYHRLSIRNQRTRWGSCSSQKNISLNWRLIQLPDKHADYVMLHELNHLRHMNHSKRFWDSLRSICPWMDSSERWITQHGHFLTDGCGPV